MFPSGTFNHFARDVGIGSFDDSLRALEAGEAVAVDVAAVNGVPFLNTAVLGAYPDVVRRRDRLQPRVGRWLAISRARTVLSTLVGLTEHNGVHHTRLATDLRVESRCGPVRMARDGEASEPAVTFRFAKLPGALVVYRPARPAVR